MKVFERKAILMSMILPACGAMGADRVVPFEAETLTGCYVEKGVIKLHRELPTQEGDKNLILSCAKPMNIFFQEDVFARKAGAKSDELIQIKKSAAEYAPQSDDPEASCGYIDYTKLATYQYQIATPGNYTVWFRVWAPSKANWEFRVMDDKGGKFPVNLLSSIPAPNQWFWKKGYSAELGKGNHQLQIADALNGKRISAILFTRDSSFVPEGDLKPTPLHAISEGSVLFRTTRPVGIRQWEKLQFEEKGKGGKYAFSVSSDGGRTFSAVKGNTLAAFGAEPLTVRLELVRVNGTAPEISHAAASYTYDAGQFAEIVSGTTLLSFSRKTGSLSGMVNTETGTSLQPAGYDGNMFEILLKSPGKEDRRHLSMKDAKLAWIRTPSKDNLGIRWEFPAERIGVEFAVTAKDGVFEWNVTVDNRHPSSDVIEVEAPILSELKAADNASDDTLIWPFSAGEFIPFPAEKGEFSITYPDHAGLPFTFLGNGREGVYFGCHDKKLLITRFTSRANASSTAIELSVTRKHRIASGSSRTDTFVVAAFTGTWHKGADLYRKFFYSVYPVNQYRPWLRNSDGWLQGGAAGHAGLMKQYESYSEFQRDFKRAAFLSIDYIQMWGSIFNGACPSYYLPRLDKGGEKLFASEMKYWRDHGGFIGHYYFANGISPYYLLTDVYFGVPWSDYPAEYRPPSFDWYVKNREYISDGAKIDETDLRSKTAQINEVHRKKQIVKGNYEESLTGYMPMSWRNGSFAGFLRKWIAVYVEKYNCNTAYLDTFAFRNDLADFNPYMKLNGEGDKPVFKMAFLNELIPAMRKKEPEFCALTEGIADVFGTHLYFLLSGFARDPNIFRYTIPDQIIFQGSCNGLWSKPLTRKSIQQAFLCGNRFDLVLLYPETYYMLRLRQRISPFLNRAVFDDVRGIEVSDPGVQAFAHRMLPETDSIISNGGTKAVTLTLGNPDLKNATLSYKLPDSFRLKKALLFELYKDPVPLKFTQKDGTITFDVPKIDASAVILIDEVRDIHQFTAVAEQTATDSFTVEIFNVTPKETEFTVEAGKETKKIRIQPYEEKSVVFTDPGQGAKFAVVPVTVSAKGMPAFRRVISIGDTGSRIPMPELPTKEISKAAPLVIDFEESVYSDKAAASGKRGLLLSGNGKTQMFKIPLNLAPNAHYEMTLALRKSKEVSPKPGDCYVMVANYTKDKKLERYVTLGGNVAADGEFHNLKAEFDTNDEVLSAGLYLYNNNSQGALSIDDVKIVEISRAAPPVRKAEPQKETVQGKTLEIPVRIDLGETAADDSDALENKAVVRVTGNGKYLQRKIPLTLEPDQTYRLSFSIRKGFNVSKVMHENMVAVCNYTKDRKLETYLVLASSIEGDGKYHRCQGTFTTTGKLDSCGLYIYNRNSTDTVSVGDIKLVKISGKPEAKK